MKILPWILAARPKTLTAAFVPVLVAWALVPKASYLLALCGLMSSIFIQIATNLINDAIDGKRGTDKKRIGPVRVTQSGLLSYQTVYWGGWGCFFIAALFALPLIWVAGWPLLLVLIASIAAGYGYTGGPFPLSYKGFGDLFVFLFFGLVSTLAMQYALSLHITWTGLLAGVQVGLLSTTMIAINNLRDTEGDRLSHKMTLPVRFGTDFGRIEIAITHLLPFALSFLWMLTDRVAAVFLPFVLFPLALFNVLHIYHLKHAPTCQETGARYNVLLAKSSAVYLGFGIMLALGVIV